jgi:hypothetical protein
VKEKSHEMFPFCLLFVAYGGGIDYELLYQAAHLFFFFTFLASLLCRILTLLFSFLFLFFFAPSRSGLRCMMMIYSIIAVDDGVLCHTAIRLYNK